MERITITIECGNAAFTDNPGEITDILATLGEKIEGWDERPTTLKDHNGNIVGSVVYQ